MCMCTVYVGIEHVLPGLSERATFEHNPEHGLLVGLLVDEARRVGVRPPTSGGNVSVGEMLLLGRTQQHTHSRRELAQVKD